MQKRKALLSLMILAVMIPLSMDGNAATIRAASCSRSHVETAVFSASTGDTVVVPAGNCTWSSVLTISSMKKITLQGAGMDATVITANPAGLMLNMSSSGSRLTGLTLNNAWVYVDGDGWRIDHCKFYNATVADGGVQVRGERDYNHPTGLVDHCYFHNTSVLIIGDANLMANGLWAQPLNLGSASGVVYVEDCTFVATEFTNAIDANYGGRYVFRYNTVTDAYVEAHSVQGDHRATRKWEIYNNTFKQITRAMWVPMMLRGGTGVVFNNTLTGTWGLSRISLDNVRSCETRPVSGKCDGSSPWDGNQINGYPCRDQIGRSTDFFLWTSSAPYPPQALDPAYAWNNKHGANDVTFYQHSCAASISHIQPGRDYYDNTQKPGYVPYTYPHPWAQGWNPASIAPPENLRIVEWRAE
jgi:hypothetical protein